MPEGEPVLPVQLGGFGNSSAGASNICQTCFCMGGVVHCRPLECDKPIDGCTPIKEDGHCCPDRYDCSKPAKQKSISSVGDATSVKSTGYPVASSSGSDYTTTDLSTADQEGEFGGTTETTVYYSNPSDYYVPVAITTMGSVYEIEDGNDAATESTMSSRRIGNQDSFERTVRVKDYAFY